MATDEMLRRTQRTVQRADWTHLSSTTVALKNALDHMSNGVERLEMTEDSDGQVRLALVIPRNARDTPRRAMPV